MVVYFMDIVRAPEEVVVGGGAGVTLDALEIVFTGDKGVDDAAVTVDWDAIVDCEIVDCPVAVPGGPVDIGRPGAMVDGAVAVPLEGTLESG